MSRAGNGFGQNGLNPVEHVALVDACGEAVSGFAVPAGALDKITEVEIKLALEPIVGHRMFRQFATVPFQMNR